MDVGVVKELYLPNGISFNFKINVWNKQGPLKINQQPDKKDGPSQDQTDDLRVCASTLLQLSNRIIGIAKSSSSSPASTSFFLLLFMAVGCLQKPCSFFFTPFTFSPHFISKGI